MSQNNTFRRIFLFVNYIAILSLAAMAVVQIWFEVWEDWQIFIKAIATYLVVLTASIMFKESERISGLIFGAKENEKIDITPED